MTRPAMAKVDLRKWNKVLKSMKQLETARVRVGVLASKGGLEQHEGVTSLEIAAIHEFGSPAAKIPERSFIRATFKKRRPQLARKQTQLAKKIISAAMPVPQALGLLGLWGSSAIVQFVRGGAHLEPPLSALTVARRKASAKRRRKKNAPKKRSRGQQSARASKKKTAAKRKVSGPRPLVDTGRLINSGISWEVQNL